MKSQALFFIGISIPRPRSTVWWNSSQVGKFLPLHTGQMQRAPFLCARKRHAPHLCFTFCNLQALDKKQALVSGALEKQRTWQNRKGMITHEVASQMTEVSKLQGGYHFSVWCAHCVHRPLERCHAQWVGHVFWSRRRLWRHLNLKCLCTPHTCTAVTPTLLLPCS